MGQKDDYVRGVEAGYNGYDHFRETGDLWGSMKQVKEELND